uniref:Inner membrane protein YrbG, predicted calcium/sodium:proton antiporter n=1 Tax=uncultured bacterium contig00166 TaxID=1181595 RepID=A0A806K2H1_9BACT|nr:inner membrane protein YrbG, predicted calcium/sodium:proton antiporter [uncultured bacterium contig00166]
MTPYLLVLAGLVLLYFGAEWIVSASSKLALRLGVKPIFIALTIVAFGTSVPELLVSTQSTLKGWGDLSIGNVVGSNICNIALILGLSAIICPIHISKQLFRFEIPLVVLAALLTYIFLNDSTMARWEAIVFLAMFAGYVAVCITMAKRGAAPPAVDPAETGVGADGNNGNNNAVVGADGTVFIEPQGNRPALDGNDNAAKNAKPESAAKLVALIVVDLAILIFGADLLVDGSVMLAKSWGVSEALIGLTIVAVGTSTPELAMTTIAALRKNNDFAIGNIVGSSIFNTLCILGVAGTIRPIVGKAILPRDMLLMLAVSAALMLPLLFKRVMARWMGAALFLTYVVYIVVLCKGEISKGV